MASAPPMPSNLSLSLDRPAWCPRPAECTTLMAYEQKETQKPRLCVGRRTTPLKTPPPSKPDTHNVCFPDVSPAEECCEGQEKECCAGRPMTIAVNQADMSFFIGLFCMLRGDMGEEST